MNTTMVLTVNKYTAIETLSTGDLVAAGLFFFTAKTKKKQTTKKNAANEMA